MSPDFTLDPDESVLWTGRSRLSAVAGALALGGGLVLVGTAVLAGVRAMGRAVGR